MTRLNLYAAVGAAFTLICYSGLLFKDQAQYLNQNYPTNQCYYNETKHKSRGLVEPNVLLSIRLQKVSFFQVDYYEYDPKCWMTSNYFMGQACWKKLHYQGWANSFLKDFIPFSCPHATLFVE